jgi:hypothetical protein
MSGRGVGHARVARALWFFWTGNVRLPLQRRDGLQPSLVGTHPARRGTPTRIWEPIRLTPTVGNEQHHIRVDWSRVDRLPSEFFREHASQSSATLGPCHRATIATPAPPTSDCAYAPSCKGLPSRAECMRRILRLNRVGFQIVRQHIWTV